MPNLKIWIPIIAIRMKISISVIPTKAGIQCFQVKTRHGVSLQKDFVFQNFIDSRLRGSDEWTPVFTGVTKVIVFTRNS